VIKATSKQFWAYPEFLHYSSVNPFNLSATMSDRKRRNISIRTKAHAIASTLRGKAQDQDKKGGVHKDNAVLLRNAASKIEEMVREARDPKKSLIWTVDKRYQDDAIVELAKYERKAYEMGESIDDRELSIIVQGVETSLTTTSQVGRNASRRTSLTTTSQVGGNTSRRSSVRYTRRGRS